MKKSAYKNNLMTVRRKLNIRRILFVLAGFCVFIVLVFFVSRTIVSKISAAPAISRLDRTWNNKEYDGVFSLAENILAENSFHNTALMYRGYSAFYLALSQTDPQLSQFYIDKAVNSLRLALMKAPKKTRPQIEYMLGKTYFHKNVLSAYHYYADSAIQYLTAALTDGYAANDIYEYLGLSYAALNMTAESTAAFTEALLVNDSDILQLAIAEQYYKSGRLEAAKPYLYQIKNTSTDELIVLMCANLLGQIYTDEKNYTEARQEFESILKKDPNAADAYYGLGVLYEKEGDMIRARAEWRKALKAQVNHPGALKKMGLS